MLTTYALIWLIILSFTLFVYFVSDGGALGMSILLPWLNHTGQRKALSLLLPVWDANQTWLVFTLAGLYGGFPRAFSLVMTTLYLPIILLLLMLMCRGAAIEYLVKSKNPRWNYVLALSSLLIILLQGYALSSLINFALEGQIATDVSISMLIMLCGSSIWLLFYVLLGMSQLYDRMFKSLMRVTVGVFFVLYISFGLIYPPLKDHYWIISGSALLIMTAMVAALQHGWPRVFKWALIGFSAVNMLVAEYYLFPYIFPLRTNAFHHIPNLLSLKWMTDLSLVMLPLLFVTLAYFRAYFSNHFDDVGY